MQQNVDWLTWKKGFMGLRDAQGQPLDHSELFLQFVVKRKLFLPGIGVL